MVSFTFTTQAEKIFKRLPKEAQQRILKKLKSYNEHQDILSVVRILYNFTPATHRLRIGNYRLILELRENTDKLVSFTVLDVGHRKDIYK